MSSCHVQRGMGWEVGCCVACCTPRSHVTADALPRPIVRVAFRHLHLGLGIIAALDLVDRHARRVDAQHVTPHEAAIAAAHRTGTPRRGCPRVRPDWHGAAQEAGLGARLVVAARYAVTARATRGAGPKRSTCHAQQSCNRAQLLPQAGRERRAMLYQCTPRREPARSCSPP